MLKSTLYVLGDLPSYITRFHKLDQFVESVTRKVAAYLGEVLEDQRDKLHENLMANNSKFVSNYIYFFVC